MILFSSLLLILIVEYERYLDHLGPASAYDVIIPYRYGSQLWGRIASTELPTFLRRPIYSLYARLFGANLNEMGLPLDAYASLGDFFARPLKPGTPLSPPFSFLALTLTLFLSLHFSPSPLHSFLSSLSLFSALSLSPCSSVSPHSLPLLPFLTYKKDHVRGRRRAWHPQWTAWWCPMGPCTARPSSR